MEDITKDAINQLNMVIDCVTEAIPRVGKLYKILYDSLVLEGFTEDQALKIVTNYNPNFK